MEINEDIVRFGTGNQSNPDFVIMEITGYNVKPNSLTIDSTLCWINMETDEELSYRGFSLKVETSDKYGIFCTFVHNDLNEFFPPHDWQ